MGSGTGISTRGAPPVLDDQDQRLGSPAEGHPPSLTDSNPSKLSVAHQTWVSAPADWSRPVFADDRPVYARSPTFAFGPRRRQTAVTLNRSQRSSTCRALSFSARSLCSPLRSKMA